MKKRSLLYFLPVLLTLVAACMPLPPTIAVTDTPQGGDNIATPTVVPPTVPLPTDTLIPEITPTTEVPPTSTQVTSTGQQFLAYVSNGQLLVTDVTNGVKGGTTQYTVAGESDQVMDLVWSPSGEFVAFVAAPHGEQHLF